MNQTYRSLEHKNYFPFLDISSTASVGLSSLKNTCLPSKCKKFETINITYNTGIRYLLPAIFRVAVSRHVLVALASSPPPGSVV